MDAKIKMIRRDFFLHSQNNYSNPTLNNYIFPINPCYNVEKKEDEETAHPNTRVSSPTLSITSSTGATCGDAPDDLDGECVLPQYFVTANRVPFVKETKPDSNEEISNEEDIPKISPDAFKRKRFIMEKEESEWISGRKILDSWFK